MRLSITNVHLDLGAGKRGTDMGPSAIHLAGLVPKLEAMGHTIANVKSCGIGSADAQDPRYPKARFLDEIHETCAFIAERVEAELGEGHTPLVLGGDHSQAIGTLSGMANHYRKNQEDIGVIWVDAHTDMNTPESSPSGNIHGMPLASLLGHGPKKLVELAGQTPALNPEKVVVFGARDVDATEIPIVKDLGIRGQRGQNRPMSKI